MHTLTAFADDTKLIIENKTQARGLKQVKKAI